MTMAKPQAESKRKVLLCPGEDSYFVVEVPSLPGCISQGKTREEALANIEEVIALYIEVLQDRGEPIPNDTSEPISQRQLAKRSRVAKNFVQKILKQRRETGSIAPKVRTQGSSPL